MEHSSSQLFIIVNGPTGVYWISAGPGVSTTDQDLSIQEAALKAAGCEVIRAEKRSGTTTQGRDELRTVQAAPPPRIVLGSAVIYREHSHLFRRYGKLV